MSKFLSLLAISVMVLSTAAVAAEKSPSKEQCAKAKTSAERSELGCKEENKAN